MEFKPGATFSSWVDFFIAVEEYKEKTFQPMIMYSCRLARKANLRIKPGRLKYPDTEDLKYSYYDLRCTHRGFYISKGENKRNTSSFKSGCPARIYATVDKLKEIVVLRIVVDIHNHETKLASLATLNLPLGKIRQYAKREYGQSLTFSDMNSIKFRAMAKGDSRPWKRSYSQENLLEAMSKVQSGEMELCKAAKHYHIPYATLRDRLALRPPDSRGTALNNLEENKVVLWLLEMAKTGFHVTRQDFKEAVGDIWNARGTPTKSSEHQPSKKWMHSFFSRHPEVAECYPGEFWKSNDYVTKPLDPMVWFSRMKNHMETFDPTLLLSPDRLYSADEIYFKLCPQEQKVTTCEGSKLTTGSAAWHGITVVGCASAAGHLLPPICVFPFNEIPSYNPLEAFDSAMFQISPHGRVTPHVFLSWLRDCFIPAVTHHQKPVALFVDALSAHRSHVDIVELCTQHSIILYCIDDQNTGLVPPLEQPFLSHIEQMCAETVGPGVALCRDHSSQQTFAGVLKTAWSTNSNYDLAVEGFARTGIYPFDFDRISGLEDLVVDQNLCSSGCAGLLQPKSEPLSPLSDTDTDPMDHLLVTQASTEALTSRPSEYDYDLKTDVDSMCHLTPSTEHLVPSQDPTPALVTAVTPGSPQKTTIDSIDESQTNSISQNLSQPAWVVTGCPHVSPPHKPPLPTSNSHSHFLNFSDKPSLDYIKLLLQIAFSHGEATTMDVLDKYAAGNTVAEPFQAMIDVLNVLLDSNKSKYSKSPDQTKTLADQFESGTERVMHLAGEQSQPQLSSLIHPSVDKSQVPLCSCHLQPQAHPSIQLQSVKKNSRGFPLVQNSLTSNTHSQYSEQHPVPRPMHLQSTTFTQLAGMASKHPANQSQILSHLPVALTGKAFAVYLDVKRREREKMEKGEGVSTIVQVVEEERCKLGKRKKNQQASGRKKKKKKEQAKSKMKTSCENDVNEDGNICDMICDDSDDRKKDRFAAAADDVKDRKLKL
ncbi:tigger transposable element-derived protein 6-like protein [Plakobranchus ocellatus]|uniref:Tigger transposable element-derived protein 6-like protein n=1 Tax=Plakobranchus ocellatus TaxID=259542 RepID=A0AAV3ZB45_9GAST|nr:tigger transposable element-derived protein 6-like protein [Plakobranchus ocellatus]